MKPVGKIKIEWSPDFAYVIGLITTDGNLSKDGRHIHFTSKDLELIEIFKKCLNLTNTIGKKARGGSSNKKYYVVQFGDVQFYNFLLSIGLKQAKSKTLQRLQIPSAYFPDFFRGCIDGDGNIAVTVHPESRYPQLRLRLFSASPEFLKWIKGQITKQFGIAGGWMQKIHPQSSVTALSYGKADAIVILKNIYYYNVSSFLKRKYKIAELFLGE